MSTNHTQALGSTSQAMNSESKVRSGYFAVFLTLGFGMVTTGTAVAQRSGPPPVSASPPGIAARERNRQMDEYDRELERLKNDSKVPSERRKNMFPQINEDFQKIQVIHNEMIHLIQGDNSLKYDRLIELTSDLKKRSNRLRMNLALPSDGDGDQHPDKSTDNSVAPSEAGVKKSVVTLHDVIVSFVTNPLFKNLGLLDARAVSRANDDLKDMIQLSDSIKKTAETLGKVSKK